MKQADDIKRIYEQAKIDTLGNRDKAVLEKMKEIVLAHDIGKEKQ